MKKIISTTTKIIWLIIGLAILSWTIFWYYQIRVIGNLGGVIAVAVLLGTGIYALMFFMLITALFIIIKLVNKFITKKRKK
ncbi:MAG: hypothetical protein ABFQ65_02395 [Nanoarchaeota archaeon]